MNSLFDFCFEAVRGAFTSSRLSESRLVESLEEVNSLVDSDSWLAGKEPIPDVDVNFDILLGFVEESYEIDW